MCGDFDDLERIDEELFERFVDRARTLGVNPSAPNGNAPARLQSEAARREYMSELFSSGLARCVSDAAGLPAGERMDVLAGQAIVLGRLAGFLAAQFPPEADRFRTVVGAVMDAFDDSEAAHGRKPD